MKLQRALPACELCVADASVRCDADNAFLCWPCDAAVHGANFLVARHVRLAACAACRSLDADAGFCFTGGADAQPRGFCCRSCGASKPCCSTSSSSSRNSCVSTAESSAATCSDGRSMAAVRRRRRSWNVDERVERVLCVWSLKMGLRDGRVCVAKAADVLAECEAVTAALPVRVALAAALWFAVKNCGENDEEGSKNGRLVLRRLEACSGVVGRLVVAAEARIAGAFGRRRGRVMD